MCERVLTFKPWTGNQRAQFQEFTLKVVWWSPERGIVDTLIQLGYSTPTEIEGSPPLLLVERVCISTLPQEEQNSVVSAVVIDRHFRYEPVHRHTGISVRCPLLLRHTTDEGDNTVEIDLLVNTEQPIPRFRFDKPPVPVSFNTQGR